MSLKDIADGLSETAESLGALLANFLHELYNADLLELFKGLVIVIGAAGAIVLVFAVILRLWLNYYEPVRRNIESIKNKSLDRDS